MRLLLRKHFVDHISRPGVHKLLLHEDNQALVSVLNAIVSTSALMVVELRKAEAAAQVDGSDD